MNGQTQVVKDRDLSKQVFQGKPPMALKDIAILNMLPLLCTIPIDDDVLQGSAMQEAYQYLSSLSKSKDETLHLRMEMALRLFVLKYRQQPSSEQILIELEHFQSKDLIPLLNRPTGASARPKPEKNSLSLEQTIRLLERECKYRRGKLFCLLCGINIREVLSLPCGDITMCRNCSDLHNTCPACQRQIIAEVNVYFG